MTNGKKYVLINVLAFLLSLGYWIAVEEAEADSEWRNPIIKQGYLDSPLVETVPLSFKGELYLLENWRTGWGSSRIDREEGTELNEVWMARLPHGPEEYDKREYTARVLVDHTLATAKVWEDRVYVFGTATKAFADGRTVSMSYSEDMKNWSEPVEVFRSYPGRRGQFPEGVIFNTSVTRDPDDNMVFLWETNGLGRNFTMRFGRVEEPTEIWNPGIIKEAVYGKDKYTGGPGLYYEGGWYYLLYLEHLGGRAWETRITRSKNLVNWQDAPEGRAVVTFNPQWTGRRGVRESNASDVALCYHDGRTILFYTGANQREWGDLQWATFDGTPRELLEHFFIENDE